MDNPFTTIISPTCATAIQMLQRTSYFFYLNVGINNFIYVLLLVALVYVANKLWKHSCFSDSATAIIYSSLFNCFFHGAVYSYIQIWSLYRSLMYPNNPCQIMFHESECWLLYRLNIFSRLWMICTYTAQAIDGLIGTIRPEMMKRGHGYVMNLLSFLIAVLLCYLMTGDEVTDALASNCLQRQGRNLTDLENQINMYLYPIAASILIHTVTGIINLFKKIDIDQTINSRSEIRTAKLSSVAFFGIMIVQLLGLSVYSVSVNYIINHVTELNPVYLADLVMYSYTYTYCGLIYPIGIMISARLIKWSRHKLIATTRKIQRTSGSDEHFNSLAIAWGGPVPVPRRRQQSWSRTTNTRISSAVSASIHA